MRQLVEKPLSIERQRRPQIIQRQAHGANSIPASQFQEDRQDGRMEVEVEVAVQMGKDKAGGIKCLELGLDLAVKLGSQWPDEEVSKAREDSASRKVSLAVD